MTLLYIDKAHDTAAMAPSSMFGQDHSNRDVPQVLLGQDDRHGVCGDGVEIPLVVSKSH